MAIITLCEQLLANDRVIVCFWMYYFQPQDLKTFKRLDWTWPQNPSRDVLWPVVPYKITRSVWTWPTWDGNGKPVASYYTGDKWERRALILSFVGSKPALMKNKKLILSLSLFIVMNIRCPNWLLMNMSTRFKVAFEWLLAFLLQACLILRTRLILLANGSVDATLNEVRKPRGSLSWLLRRVLQWNSIIVKEIPYKWTVTSRRSWVRFTNSEFYQVPVVVTDLAVKDVQTVSQHVDLILVFFKSASADEIVVGDLTGVKRQNTALSDPALWWAIKGLSLILINANTNPRVGRNENTRCAMTNIFQGDCVKSHLPWHCFFIPQISGINVIFSDVTVIKMISEERDEREIENMGEREVWLCVASYGVRLGCI